MRHLATRTKALSLSGAGTALHFGGWRQIAACVLTVSFLVSCSHEIDGPEGLGQNRSDAIWEPDRTHLEDDLESTDLDRDSLLLDAGRAFDTRRDVWEDEDPVRGEDPTRWDQTSPSHVALHGTRPIRRYGHQWVRSYALNSVVAFFKDSELKPVGDGLVQPMTDLELALTDDNAAQRVKLAQDGFGLCDGERFKEQFGAYPLAQAYCTGTLIDDNLILTASHCLRSKLNLDEEGQHFDLVVPLEDVRVAFNYVVPENGAIPQMREQDVFRVREVLSSSALFVDFSILQLVDEAGNPAEVTAGRPPVPLWHPTEAPSQPSTREGQEGRTLGLHRQAAAVGAGVGLPLKVSTSRSMGWWSDTEFLGLNLEMDIFGGNSGGPIFDLETGTLVGVLVQQFERELRVKCGDPEAQDRPAWPSCVKSDGGELDEDSTPTPVVANVLPRFINNEPVAECTGWMPHLLSPGRAELYKQWIMSKWKVNDVDIDPPKSNDHNFAVSIEAIRSVACPAATAATAATDPVPFDDAVVEALADVEERREALTSSTERQADCGSFDPLNNDLADPECPSLHALGSFAALTIDLRPEKTKIQIGDGDETGFLSEATLLANSTLCAGVTSGPEKTFWSEAREIPLVNGREFTIHGTTEDSSDHFAFNIDFDVPTPDELYRIEVDEWTILYADTFSGGLDLGSNPVVENPGTNFDTALFLAQFDGADEDPFLFDSSWGAGAPFDDTTCGPQEEDGPVDVLFQRQSQLFALLEPNKKYLLGVTGFNGDVGEFNLHVQSMPAARNGFVVAPENELTRIERDGVEFHVFSAASGLPLVAGDASEQNCGDPDGPFDPTCVYNVHPQLTCQGRDTGEAVVIALSCPEFSDAEFRFRVTGTNFLGLGLADDPVAAFWEGHAFHGSRGYVCSDDTLENLGLFSEVQSFEGEIGHPLLTELPGAQTSLYSGAAIRGFFANQFRPDLNWQNIGYLLNLPVGSVHVPPSAD